MLFEGRGSSVLHFNIKHFPSVQNFIKYFNKIFKLSREYLEVLKSNYNYLRICPFIDYQERSVTELL